MEILRRCGRNTIFGNPARDSASRRVRKALKKPVYLPEYSTSAWPGAAAQGVVSHAHVPYFLYRFHNNGGAIAESARGLKRKFLLKGRKNAIIFMDDQT